MTNKYYKEHRERLQKEAHKKYQIFLKKKGTKGEKRLEKDM